MTIGERVRILRKELRMTQGEFGSRINISTASISQIEKGIVKTTERTINDLCRVYGVSRNWLVDGVGEMYEETESLDDLAFSFTELLANYPGILAMAKLASKHMTVEDWKRLNELIEKVVGE